MSEGQDRCVSTCASRLLAAMSESNMVDGFTRRVMQVAGGQIATALCSFMEAAGEDCADRSCGFGVSKVADVIGQALGLHFEQGRPLSEVADDLAAALAAAARFSGCTLREGAHATLTSMITGEAFEELLQYARMLTTQAGLAELLAIRAALWGADKLG